MKSNPCLTILRVALVLTLLAPLASAHLGPESSGSLLGAGVGTRDTALGVSVDVQDVPGASTVLGANSQDVPDSRPAWDATADARALVPESVTRTAIAKNPVRYHDLTAVEAAAAIPLLPGDEVTVRAERGFGPTLADVAFAALGEEVRADAGHAPRATSADAGRLQDARAPTASAALHDAPAAPALAPAPRDAVPTPTLAPAPADDAGAPARERGDAQDVRAASSRAVDARAADGALRVARAVAVAAAAVALPALAAWALYHRVTGAAVLKNPARQAMMEHLRDAPGAGVKALADAAGVTYTTATYHLQRLESAGHVVSTRANGALRYYVTGTLDARGRAWDELFAHPVARRVLAFIEANPGTHRAAVARGVDLSVTGVAWYLKRLEAAGLLERRPDGRRTRLFTVAGTVGAARERVRAIRDGARA